MPPPHARQPIENGTVADVPCPFCCCACDDLQVRVEGGQITSVDGACEIALPCFLGTAERPVCRVDGKPAEIDDALRRAAELLADARYPLIFGLSRATCEAQRIAVGIAETLRGVIDIPASRGETGAMQSVGEVTATFGEIRNRADLIVAWGVDPLTCHPRFFERYAPAKQLIVIDNCNTPTAELADEWIAIREGSDFDAASALRGIAKGLRLSPQQVVKRTGVALSVWQALFNRLTQARHGVLLTSDGEDSVTARRTAEALAHLVRDLNHRTRFVAISLRTAPNGLGAENVLAWRIGYSAGVDFSRGFPRFDPDVYSAEKLLSAGVADAMLIVCDDSMSSLSAATKQRFMAIPTIALDWRQTPTMATARVAIPLATIGVESGGTIFRGDGVPLALRPAIKTALPADHEALSAISSLINELRAAHA
jgi:formylmethanofuran dehydrogenase subunit B